MTVISKYQSSLLDRFEDLFIDEAFHLNHIKDERILYDLKEKLRIQLFDKICSFLGW